ncbi:acyltransferase family protein [Alteromonas sp. AMM-1]|uniref:acyltransferase family protein n=1 Tax=Alteromonas sp. AMM-1 TaxID=3394233 RepID=UPI0039A52924
MKYRKDIDGLRALAVLPVLIFHAQLGFFEGGFLGVDVFFVISGFLITSILVEEISQKTFTFANFYERRVRRLLPALIFMTAVTSVLAYQFMITVDLQGYGNSLFAMSLFSSNIFFWMDSGYFDRVADLKPMLHTWSLAVEEQYYFFFPLVLLVVLRWFPKLLTLTVLIILVFSLSLATWGATNAPDANFYLLPTRAWELMFGSLASILIFNNVQLLEKLRAGNVLKNTALVVLIICLFTFDESLPHPSLLTLIPVLATLVLIVIPAQQSFAHQILTLRPMVFIGLISYSLYLWHQPLLVFQRYISAKPNPVISVTLLVIACLLAYLSWRYVEKPFRHRNVTSRNQVYTFCGVSFAAIIGFGLYAGQEGIPSRYNAEQQVLMSYLQYSAPVGQPDNQAHCFLGEDEDYQSLSASCYQDKSVLLWGDSHANALATGLRVLQGNALGEITSSACLPLTDTHFPHRKHCQSTNAFVLEQLRQGQYNTVILHGNWYSHEDKISSLKNTLSALASLNIEVIVIGGVPHYLPDLPSFLLTKRLPLNAQSAQSRVEPTLFHEIAAIDQHLAAVSGQFDNVTFMSALAAFCESPQQCTVVLPSYTSPQQWVPTAWDYGHLTLEGAMYLSKSLPANALDIER